MTHVEANTPPKLLIYYHVFWYKVLKTPKKVIYFQLLHEKTDNKVMKRYLYLPFFILISFAFMSCNNNSGLVKGDAPIHIPTDTTTTPTVVVETKILYGGYFDIANSGLYESLMSSCRRCGLKRIHTNPYGGGTTYERIYDLFGQGLIQKCSYWINSGYIQIEFDGPGLPTTASVTIKPKSSKQDPHNNSYIWGEAFTITGDVLPINKNKGFNIRLFPSNGLGGNFSLIIQSRTKNHVKHDKLNINATYGSSSDDSEQNEIISADLIKLKSPAVTSQFTCGQYTN